MTTVAARFGLGSVLAGPVRVPGGLSNELWRVQTESGLFAVKRMVLHADRPDFVGNVEAAFRVERRAHAAGVPMPAPVPDPATGRALARIGEALVRVHIWVDGTASDGAEGVGSGEEAAALLARVHAAGAPRWARCGESGWPGTGWGDEVTTLARRVSRRPARMLEVDSHRDLDRKNTLRRPDGVLCAVDWDAAGAVGAAHEAVAVALDWAGPRPAGFRSAVEAYRAATDVEVPAEPWVFGGWVDAHGGWLDHNATARAGTALGDAEAAAALDRLTRVAADLDLLLDALA